MRVRFAWMLLAASLLLSFAPGAYAQGSFFTSLSGTVVDTSGAVIPGANVEVKNNGTGEKYNVVSGTAGEFTVASLPGGSYSVTTSLMGFKTTDIVMLLTPAEKKPAIIEIATMIQP